MSFYDNFTLQSPGRPKNPDITDLFAAFTAKKAFPLFKRKSFNA